MPKERHRIATVEDGYDVFLSHDGRDKAVVEGIARKLVRAGLAPWLDAWYLAGGGRWQDELAEGLDRSSACAVFLGVHDLGAWAQEEVAVARNRAARDRRFRLIPVLLPGLPEPFDPTSLPAFLATRTWVDFRRGVDDARALQALVNAVRGVPFGPSGVVAPLGEPPYRGLQVFDEEHAHLFFGRDADVQRLVEKLKASRFLAVVGPSGSGKSSLVRAGLVPALRRGVLRPSEEWPVAVLTPGARPLTALAAQLVRLGDERAMQVTLDELADDPRTLHLAVALVVAGRPPDAGAVCVVDQVEEAFTLCRDEAERGAFFANLLHAATVPGGQAIVIVTLRADFYPRVAAYPEFAQLVAAHQFLVSPLGEEGLRQAIEEPAAAVGLEFEPGLVDTIVEDVAGEPGALPLLEHALLELWKRRSGTMLTLPDYRETGGVAGALGKDADAVLKRFTRNERDIARRVLLRLTQPGEGVEDTRRRATMSELVTRVEEEEAVEAVVRSLAGERLLTLARDDVSGEPVVDVSHEALIRGWPLLRGWIDESREGLRIHRRLTEAAQEWLTLGRDPGDLYLGARLPAAIEWAEQHDAELNPLEREFLAASRAETRRQFAEEEERRRKERRGRLLALVTVVTLVVLVVIAVLAWFAFEQRNEATRQRDEATRQRDIASSRELAASAIERLSTDPELSILLALEALNQAPTAQAEDALRRAVPELSKYMSFPEPEGSALNHAVLSPDGRLLATASADGTAQLWDVATGDPGPTLDHHKDCPVDEECGVNLVVFSGNGKLVATASAGTARLWNAATGDPGPTLDHHKDCPVNDECALYQVVFSPDGKLVATAGADGTARLWNAATGDPGSTLDHHKDCPVDEECALYQVVFSPDGKLVATASDDGTARLWNAATGGPGPTLDHKTGSALRSVAFTPNSARVITGSYDGTARLWDAATGAHDFVIHVSEEQVRDANFSSDGEFVLTAAEDGTARIWDAASGAEESLLAGHSALVMSAVFSSNDELVVTASEDKTARVWDAKSGAELTVLRGHTAFVRKAAFSRGGKLVLTVSDDGTARVWEPPQVVRLQNKEAVTEVAFSSNGELIATATEDGARIWDVTASEPKVVSELLSGTEVSAVAFNSDGTRLATAAEDGARIWDVTASEPKVVSELLSGTRAEPAEVSALAFNSDGTRLATAAEDGARIWDVTASEPKVVSELLSGTRAEPAEVSALAFNSDGTRLATAAADGARIWDVTASEPKVVLKLSGHTDAVNDVVFSPDSKLLATASEDGTAIVWSAASGAQLVHFKEQAGDVTSVAFSSDNRFVVTGGSDKVARVWRPTTGEEFAVLRGAADDITGAVFSPDNRTVATASEDGTARLYRCEVCLSIEELRRLANSRAQRKVRPEERAIYLHEQ